MSDRADIMRKLPFFAKLEPTLCEKLATITKLKKLERGAVLFRQGETVQGMFFLVEGKVKIFKLSPDGKEHILHIIGPGQGFAEAALFMEGGYPAWCATLARSTILMLPKQEFIELIGREPQISLGIIASMSIYLRRFADRIEDLALKDVSARFARWLLERAEETGRDFWDLEVTKGQLAGQLGTVSETMSRTLRRFADAGHLQVRGKFMKILDRPALEKIATGEETSDF